MTTLQVGDVLDTDNLIYVTPGSILRTGTYRAVILDTGYGQYLNDAYERTVYPLFSFNGWTVDSIGDTEPVKHNLVTFLQRVRTTCIGAAYQHSVSRGPVMTALTDIGVTQTNPPLGVGMYLHQSDRDLRARLERDRGLVLGCGDPNKWNTYYEGQRGQLFQYPRIGGVKGIPLVQRVLALANPETEEYLTPATEQDEAEIARLRGQIWTIGVRAKGNNGWCSAYEQAVSTLGVSRASVTEVRGTVRAEAEPVLPTPTRRASDGTPIIDGAAQQGEYPDGAVFEFGNNGEPITDYGAAGHWNWMRKVPENLRHRPDYGSGTRHYIGPNQGDYGGNCRVLWDGVSNMRIPITPSLMPRLPAGTVIGDGAGLGVRYVKQENGTWRHETNGAPATDDGFFGITQQQNGTPSTTWFILELPTEHPGMPAPRR